jgi:hypothetical protein
MHVFEKVKRLYNGRKAAPIGVAQFSSQNCLVA